MRTFIVIVKDQDDEPLKLFKVRGLRQPGENTVARLFKKWMLENGWADDKDDAQMILDGVSYDFVEGEPEVLL